jgi:hypothetical protein
MLNQPSSLHLKAEFYIQLEYLFIYFQYVLAPNNYILDFELAKMNVYFLYHHLIWYC